MKEKTFGKESKTPFPNFKSANNIENERIFRENERNNPGDGRERKKLGEESKTSFLIFKSEKNVESKTLQNNQLKIKENQNQCEKTVELSLEIDIVKTATHPYDVAT